MRVRHFDLDVIFTFGLRGLVIEQKKKRKRKKPSSKGRSIDATRWSPASENRQSMVGSGQERRSLERLHQATFAETLLR